MNALKTYKITHLKGTIGDFAREWWTDEDRAKHETYVEELKQTGKYLQPEELTFSLVPNPAYDSPSLSSRPLESASMQFLDFSSTPIKDVGDRSNLKIEDDLSVMVNSQKVTKAFIPEEEAKLWEEFYEGLDKEFTHYAMHGKHTPEYLAEMKKIEAYKKPWDNTQGMRVEFNDDSAFCKEIYGVYYHWDYIKNTLGEAFCKVSEATSARGMTGFDF